MKKHRIITKDDIENLYSSVKSETDETLLNYVVYNAIRKFRATQDKCKWLTCANHCKGMPDGGCLSCQAYRPKEEKDGTQ